MKQVVMLLLASKYTEAQERGLYQACVTNVADSGCGDSLRCAYEGLAGIGGATTTEEVDEGAEEEEVVEDTPPPPPPPPPPPACPPEGPAEVVEPARTLKTWDEAWNADC